MNKKAKLAKILTHLLALAMVLAGCGNTGADAGSDSHTHTAGEWAADLENHWQVCSDCGEALDAAAHTMDEFDYCEVCGKSVCDYGDGTYSLLSYDEQGSLCEDACYDADGSLIYRYTYVYEYYEDGNVKGEKHYAYDPMWYSGEETLVLEAAYLYCENTEFGEVYQSEATIYFEDGSKIYTEYAENWDVLRTIEYDAEGNEISSSRYAYQQDDQGERSYMAIYVDEVLSFEEFYMAVPYSSSVVTKQVYYNEDGSVWTTTEYEYEFDDMGNPVHQVAYTDGVIDWENVYESDGEGCTYLAKEIDYDENGDQVSEIRYDAYGNEIG